MTAEGYERRPAPAALMKRQRVVESNDEEGMIVVGASFAVLGSRFSAAVVLGFGGAGKKKRGKKRKKEEKNKRKKKFFRSLSRLVFFVFSPVTTSHRCATQRKGSTLICSIRQPERENINNNKKACNETPVLPLPTHS